MIKISLHLEKNYKERQIKTTAMIDHRIILQLFVLQSEEKKQGTHHKEGRAEFVQDKALIFFSILSPNYYRKLNALTGSQYLERLKVLYPILGRSN